METTSLNQSTEPFKLWDDCKLEKIVQKAIAKGIMRFERVNYNHLRQRVISCINHYSATLSILSK